MKKIERPDDENPDNEFEALLKKAFELDDLGGFIHFIRNNKARTDSLVARGLYVPPSQLNDIPKCVADQLDEIEAIPCPFKPGPMNYDCTSDCSNFRKYLNDKILPAYEQHLRLAQKEGTNAYKLRIFIVKNGKPYLSVNELEDAIVENRFDLCDYTISLGDDN